jgi:hypothetical protein
MRKQRNEIDALFLLPQRTPSRAGELIQNIAGSEQDLPADVPPQGVDGIAMLHRVLVKPEQDVADRVPRCVCWFGPS